MSLHARRILLIISGGIAAYKSLDLIRRLREQGAQVRCILTSGGAQFVTPLSVGALSEEKVYGDLFSLTDEQEMGHIRLSREADLVLVAPASADLIAKMAHGLADDLASAVLLASDKPVMIAPAMNVMMWQNAATQANIATLRARGIRLIGPNAGDMACGETGEGRMAESQEILASVQEFFAVPGPLAGRRALVTSGPTHEPLDPVRYIANRSSGRQGHAIAQALARLGAETVLVTGPTNLPDPSGMQIVRVETALQMLEACKTALPVDVAVCAAAVADWRPAETGAQKIKKSAGETPAIKLAENPDILAALSRAGNMRPRLVVGFAAETENLLKNAAAKLDSKGCDWIVANDVGAGVFGAEDNQITLLRRGAKQVEQEAWPRQSKDDIARQLADRIAQYFAA